MLPAEAQLKFLQDVQALLEDGAFVATYKYALLVALADLAVELESHEGRPTPVALEAIAAKMVEYYWQQSDRFVGSPGGGVLLQNTGRQAAVVDLLAGLHARYQSLAQLRADAREWRRVIARTVHTLRLQPLFRLQVVGGATRIFLYPHEERDGCIELLPGVAELLRRFHPLVTGLARDRWMARIRGLPANQYAVGQAADLERFLFGASREPTARYLTHLLDLQEGTCLYCARSLSRPAAHVDHFVPWVLHRLDALPNLVAAHGTCNLAKSDMLAAEEHLERWVERNRGLAATDWVELGAPPGSQAIATRVAGWAYERAYELRSMVWLRGREREVLGGRFRAVLSMDERRTVS